MTPKQLHRKQLELEKLRDRIRAKGYSIETERSYVPAVAKYIDFLCSGLCPSDIKTERKVEAFLTQEARRGVAASTQNAKFHAILFYYLHVRGERLENVDALRAKTGDQKRQAPPRLETEKLIHRSPFPTHAIPRHHLRLATPTR